MRERVDKLVAQGVDPALKALGARYDTPEARALMLAIAMQESRIADRVQVRGPARGFWQFEKMGGVHGVLGHHATGDAAKRLCTTYQVLTTKVYDALAYHDPLAAGFARLLLWAGPKPLPRFEDGPAPAWDYYLAQWRPGKPHAETWAGLWEQAWSAVRA